MTPEVTIDRQVELKSFIRKDLPCLIEGWQARQITDERGINACFYEPAGEAVFKIKFNEPDNRCWVISLSLKGVDFAPSLDAMTIVSPGGYSFDLKVISGGALSLDARKTFVGATEGVVDFLPFKNFWAIDNGEVVLLNDAHCKVSKVSVGVRQVPVFIPIVPIVPKKVGFFGFFNLKKDKIGGGVLITTDDVLREPVQLELIKNFLKDRDYQKLR